MAALTVTQRTQIWRGLMRAWSKIPHSDPNFEVTNFTKYQLYNPNDDTGAIAELDNWFDTHSGNTTTDSVGANGSINTTMRSAMTLKQKGLMTIGIIAMRSGSIEVLKLALGTDVD